MKTAFELVAEFRDAQGKGASRRLRHANKVPAILYGGHREPRALSLDHTRLLLLLDNERFYSTIINLKVGELNQAAILKDVQRHPAKNAVVHIDLQRVLDDEKIRITIPLHYKGEAGSPGVKKGGVVSHLRNEVEVICLPKDLPEFIEVDLSGVDINQMVYLADLKVPTGVEIPELTHGRKSRKRRRRAMRRQRRLRRRARPRRRRQARSLRQRRSPRPTPRRTPRSNPDPSFSRSGGRGLG
jgi:large subunit ribosomal protein L25